MKNTDYNQESLFEEETIPNTVIIGTDEAGRGPLAGPVCASAAVLDQNFPIEILNDSKKLSEKKRYEIEQIIKEKALCYSVTWNSSRKIDEINILQASLNAMKDACIRIIKNLCIKKIYFNAVKIYIDGNKVFKITEEEILYALSNVLNKDDRSLKDTPFMDAIKRINIQAVIKGDSKIPEIMAASILAKTARDRYMLLADKKWSMYGFSKHKGYPTKSHVMAIKKYGFCPIHRKTFKLPERYLDN